jgi:glycosyltransferase involved in cell wall biosynthesis
MNATIGPLVSIITPSFNQAAYLEVCIHSVLGQDYQPIEFSIFDGGSTDGSLQIIERYQPKLAHWESGPDLGQADAINKGLTRASGEIVAWLNSDDVYLPGAVAEAVDALAGHPEAAMVYGDGLMVDSDLRLLDPHRYRQLDLIDLLAFEVLLQPAVFMRRSALEQVGLLDKRYHLVLDHELWVRLAADSPIVHVPRFWALERTHGAAKTIARAAEFADEARLLLDRAGRSPQLQPVYQSHQRRIEAGYNVFAARRWIDAGGHRRAVRHLWRAWRLQPRTVLRYWYKVVQAVFSTLGLAPVFEWYQRMRRQVQYRGARAQPAAKPSE